MEYIVSIIIPIYNVEKYLERCLDSVVKQTLQGIQVILVDDGGNDRSGQIADRYVEKYNNFMVIHKENGGLSSARNIGLRHVKGKYTLFLDSDDLLPEDACEKLINTAEKYQADIVTGRSATQYSKNHIEPVPYLEKNFKLAIGENHINKQEIAIDCPVATAKLFKTSLILDNGLSFPEGITGEDVVFSIYCIHKAKSFYIIPDIVYLRTIREDEGNLSITQQKTIKIVKDRIEVIKKGDAYCDKYQLKAVKRRNRSGAVGYIYRTIEGMENSKEQVEAYKIFKNFVDEHFEDKRSISRYGKYTYEQLAQKAHEQIKKEDASLDDTVIYFQKYIDTKMKLIAQYDYESEKIYFANQYKQDLKELLDVLINKKISLLQMKSIVKIIREFVILEKIEIETGNHSILIELINENQINMLMEVKTYLSKEYKLVTIEELEREEIKYTKLYNELLNSNSWRLTSGLRKIKQLIRK